MRNLLALVGLAVVAFAGAGWYLGWYSISRHDDKIEIQADPVRASKDIKKGVQAIEDYADKNHITGTPASTPLQPPAAAPQVPLPAPPVIPPLPPMPQLPSIPAPPSIPGSGNVPQPPSMPPLPQLPQLPDSSWISPPK